MDNYIDIYCERITQGLWAEPLNAITNLSFFIAAFFVFILARSENALNARSMILIVLLVCIGTGSSLFHTFATKATMLMDVLPILFYQIAFIWLYALGVMKLPVIKAAGIFVAFIVASALSDRIPSFVLNGSLSYAPAFLFLCGFAIWHYKNAAHEKFGLLLAAGLFLMSLTFRSIDMALCPYWITGTHFMWHILNGVVLYLTARGYIKFQSGKKLSP